MHPFILNLHIRWRYLVSFTPQPLCPWQRNPVRTEQEDEWAPGSTGVWSEKKGLVFLDHELNHDHPFSSPQPSHYTE
jgi:hypothetical protein